MKRALAIIGVALIIATLLVFAGYQWGRRVANSSIKTETVTRIVEHRTLVEMPIPKAKWIEPSKKVLVPVSDTAHIMVNDTNYVAVPYQVTEYRGENYYAKVGGYKPELLALDFVSSVESTTNTNIAFKPKKHSISIGASASYCNSFSVAPWLGYEFRDGRWVVGGKAGYEPFIRKGAFEIHASFDIIQF